MSAPDHFAGGEPLDPIRSKVKLTRNAKGEPQWEISVVVDEDQEVVDKAREIAVAQWRELEREFGIGRAA